MTEGRLENLSLSRIAEGAAEAMFAEALPLVLENMIDINTEAKKERSIILKIRFIPTENRDMGRIIVDDPVVKLAPKASAESQMFIGKVDGQVQAQEFKQMTIFDGHDQDKLKSIK